MTATPDAQPAVPEGYARDAKDRLVPLSQIKPAEKLEDELVRALLSEATGLRSLLSDFKARAFGDIYSLRDLVAADYGAKLGGERGNLTLSSYDGRMQVKVQISDTLAFGPQLQAAKALIDECLTEWTEGGNDTVRALVTDAFDVGKEGKLRVDRILSLRRLASTDPRWLRAMDAIGDAIRTESSTTYVRFYQRESIDKPFAAVSLDLARLA